jgi:hypothetical protein
MERSVESLRNHLREPVPELSRPLTLANFVPTYTDTKKLQAHVQRISQDCAVGEVAFHNVNGPVEVDGQRAGGLPFANAAVQTLLRSLLVFRLLPRGFFDRDLREHWAPLQGKSPDDMTPGQMTYHLRRLRLHGLIKRITGTHRYEVTRPGWRAALLFTHTCNRVLRSGLAQIGPCRGSGRLRIATRLRPDR